MCHPYPYPPWRAETGWQAFWVGFGVSVMILSLHTMIGIGLILTNTALCIVFLRGAIMATKGGSVRDLCWPLALLFGVGGLARTLTTFMPSTYYEVTVWLMALLAAMTVCIVVPSAVRVVAKLPSKEVLFQALDDRQKMIDRLELEVAARKHFQKELETKNERLRAECDAQRIQIERLHNKPVTDQDYMEMRARLHRIRNV